MTLKRDFSSNIFNFKHSDILWGNNQGIDLENGVFVDGNVKVFEDCIMFVKSDFLQEVIHVTFTCITGFHLFNLRFDFLTSGMVNRDAMDKAFVNFNGFWWRAKRVYENSPLNEVFWVRDD